MCQSCGSTTSASAILDKLVQAADTDAAKSAKLLKTAITADKDMVEKLLPTASSHDGKLNIGA